MVGDDCIFIDNAAQMKANVNPGIRQSKCFIVAHIILIWTMLLFSRSTNERKSIKKSLVFIFLYDNMYARWFSVMRDSTTHSDAPRALVS